MPAAKIRPRATAPSDQWLTTYRTAAIEKGYGMAGGAIAGLRLTCDFHRLLGTSLLNQAGCPVCAQAKNSWHALMVREKIGVPFATPKHIMLQAFLKVANIRDGGFDYDAPGPKGRNYGRMDQHALRQVQAQLERIAGSMRLTVTELLDAAGIWNIYRHDRSRFPLLSQWVAEFKKSNRSSRQTGSRQPH